MKRKWLVVFCVLYALAVLGSCAGRPNVFDPSLPVDRTAVIYVTGIDIAEFNGIQVDWRRRNTLISDLMRVEIPGGDTEFMLNGVNEVNTGTVIHRTTYDMIPFRFHFVSGNEYTIGVGRHFVSVYSGRRTIARENRIARFDMSGGEQTFVE